ncbi:EAL domain-containing protein [Bacillus sp. S/N-304-OC-R1]|uniref:bifunctional diguanylate cyclase/phosphodiesterase n=1 Tax=Bacillus sp. S/N-304-OC-R1 TaxID=2758034 RepID=UPI001C8D436C|nr:EAL domain-containing protein [Bacillus sp. S/N-304-OC-R1]MBY0121067.1 EAL domain-containing protein [Bacillus sp. S/N-304-OC-R1]
MAKTMTSLYENKSQLNSFIEKHELSEYPSLLVQIFSGITEREYIIDLQCTLKEMLPQATVIGCTTSSGIFEGRIKENNTILSFTIFEKTELRTILLQQKSFENSYDMGKKIAQQIIDFDTKALILFAAGEKVNYQSLLEGVYDGNPQLVVSGGTAGTCGLNHVSYSMAGNDLTSQGVVGVALQSKQLYAQVNNHFNWQEIGKTFAITKANEDTIYSLDKKKPVQILKQYLGEGFIKEFAHSKFEFPFISHKGEKTPIYILGILKNGAIRVSKSVSEGELLSFSYPDIEATIESTLQGFKQIAKKSVETIFVYNSLSRQRIAHDFSEKELLMLQTIAPANGFFTNGEVFTVKQGTSLFGGGSLTYLSLSEQTSENKSNRGLTFKYAMPEHLKTLTSLTQLMEASQEDFRQLNDSLTISEQFHQSLFNNNTDIVYCTDLQGHFTNVNPIFNEIFGYEREEVIGTSSLKYVISEDIPRVRMHFFRAIKGKEQYYNATILSKNGEMNLIHFKNIPIFIDGECIGLYVIGKNMTEQKKIEEKITELANFDHDTGLPNRMRFTEQLEEMLRRAKKKKRMLAVLSIDIDRFKLINDSLGHFAGDLILKELAYRIEKVLPSGSYIGRFSGDKFTVILSKDVQIDEVMKVSKSILTEISKPVHHENQEFFVTASIGVSFYPEDGTNEHELLKNADNATNRSKDQGGNRITFFSTEMNDQAMNRLELESYLRKALHKDEFYLMYQPLIDLETGKIYGSEALIRWNHPKLGLVSPAEFIPLAEETGIIQEIGRWVLQTACNQNKKWQTLGNHHLSVAVNVSAYQFQQPGFMNDVKQALNESNLDPQYLTLELTESTMLTNIDYSIPIMRDLQQLGVKVSIDDFGTGYSSLSYLKDLPINTLKIDRSFINNLREDTYDIAIVKAIITMGHGLEVKVVAEGVETKEQIELLKELNCHYAQGFYIHRPLKITDFEKGLKELAKMER